MNRKTRTVKDNEFLPEQTIKPKLVDYSGNVSVETIFMNTNKSKTNESHKSVRKLLQILDLES